MLNVFTYHTKLRICCQSYIGSKSNQNRLINGLARLPMTTWTAFYIAWRSAGSRRSSAQHDGLVKRSHNKYDPPRINIRLHISDINWFKIFSNYRSAVSSKSSTAVDYSQTDSRHHKSTRSDLLCAFLLSYSSQAQSEEFRKKIFAWILIFFLLITWLLSVASLNEIQYNLATSTYL
jgi:hypothetical protein